MRVLALDTATETGVCIGDAGSAPRAWSVRLSGEWPQRYAQMLNLVHSLIDAEAPDVVAVESYIRGPQANHNLIGLAACAMGEARRRGAEAVEYAPATIRKHFIGVGKTGGKIKTLVYQRCKQLGWQVPNTDAADAAALWDLTCSLRSRSHQMTTVGGLLKL